MSENLTRVVQYHDRTKHHPHRYARALGYMDWSTQPDPFRRFDGAQRIPLEHPPIDQQLGYDSLFCRGEIDAASLNASSISRLFYDSMAISAWKQAPGTPPWSLRINPSSGCLHPTESYLIAGPVDGLNPAAAVYHYSPYDHTLEFRIGFPGESWQGIAGQIPQDALLVAFTSIYWRESWKYGERAFRYCHHDVGHAIGAVALSAATLGWQTRLIDSVPDRQLSTLLGIHLQTGVEAEHPDCLLLVGPTVESADDTATHAFDIPAETIQRLSSTEFSGRPNQLSREHHLWPIIDDVSRATSRGQYVGHYEMEPRDSGTIYDNAVGKDRATPAQVIIRQRRSAVSMDGQTAIDRGSFYRMIRRTMPGNLPLDTLPWLPRVSLALMLHRVNGLEQGLYVLVRDPRHLDDLRQSLSGDFEWQRPPQCADDLPLFLLRGEDYRDTARLVCCHQDIAAAGVFSLGMLAQFDAALNQQGPSAYPRLYWETGLIGQILYLEAEAAGIRATGIGCFFDDVMHDLLGIRGHAWQSLYHFTVGGQTEDLRVQTILPYAHLQ